MVLSTYLFALLDIYKYLMEAKTLIKTYSIVKDLLFYGRLKKREISIFWYDPATYPSKKDGRGNNPPLIESWKFPYIF